MSSSGEKRLGGCAEIPNSLTRTLATTSEQVEGKVDSKSHEQAVKYLQRLRPRPTQQTERFETTFTTTQRLPSRWVSQVTKKKITDKQKVAVKTRDELPCTSFSHKASVGKDHTNSSSRRLSAKNRSSVKRATRRDCSSPRAKVIKTEIATKGDCAEQRIQKRKGQVKTAKELPSSSSSAFAISRKVFLKRKLSDSAVSKGDKGRNAAHKPCKKFVEISKKTQTKLPRTLKQSPPKRLTHKTKFSGLNSNSKTGSCASSRRGSERSRQVAGVSRVSDTTSTTQSESGHCLSSNTVLMRRSRQASGEENGKRVANDCEGSGAPSRRTAGEEVSNASGGLGAASSNNDSESDDPDISRFQALLEARGLPPRLFGSLGPRMQQVLHRSIGNNSKAQQFLQGIQAEGDESQQLQSAIGMCQMLVMGNEDTLAGFPIKQSVPALMNLLKMEHNFDLMNHACRALTYMMEALPHSSAIVTDAIPILIDKLHTIQCIDVAEQSLTALEILSRRHASAVLAAGGVSSCLQYIDFFSLPAQRSALSIAANCCYGVGSMGSVDISRPEEEFGRFMKASLPLLAGRLSHHDKKCVESTCLCFVRLIDSFQQEEKVLSDIAASDLLQNFQSLLVVVPPLLSSGMVVLVLHSMTILCSKLRGLAAELLKGNIAETIHYLLCGKPSGDNSATVELLPRTSQELLEITSFVVQLLPRLPKDDPIFAVNGDNCSSDTCSKTALWQWRENSSHWRSFKRHESRMMEMAYSRGEHEIDLHTGDRSISINFEAMRLLDENTGMSEAVQRIIANESKIQETTSNDLKHDTKEFDNFVNIICPVLCQVYSSSAGSPPVRHVCLHGIHQIVFFSEPTVLEAIFSKISISRQISAMLSNPDTQIVVGALQLAELIMRKLAKIFKDSFTREGVVHRVRSLSQVPVAIEEGESRPDTNSNTRVSKRSQSQTGAVAKKPAPYALRALDEPALSTKIKARDQRPSTSNSKVSSSSRSSRVTKMASSFFSNLSPTLWGKSISSVLSSKDGSSASGLAHSGDRTSRKVKGETDLSRSNGTEKWIRKQAAEFLKDHFKEMQDGNIGEPNILDKMTLISKNLNESTDNAEKALQQLRKILDSVEVSPFEIIQSGIITSLLKYFTITGISVEPEKNGPENQMDSVHYEKLDDRIRLFLYVNTGLSRGRRDSVITGQTLSDVQPLSNIVSKVSQSVGRLEQFPVKSRELMSGRSNIMRALTTRQLKCQLQRHPDCQSGKRWLGGPIKVDALLQMKAIERFLLTKGYGMTGSTVKQRSSTSILFGDRGEEDSEEEDEIHDIELETEERDLLTSSSGSNQPITAPVHSNEGISGSDKRKHGADVLPQKLEFYINNHKIPRHMAIYQALQQYSNHFRSGSGTPEDDRFDPTFTLLNSTSFWSRTHLIFYKLEKQDTFLERKSKSQQKWSKKSISKRAREQSKNPLWLEGVAPVPVNPIHSFLTPQLPLEFCIQDPCTEALCLLRIMHAISRHWFHLYSPNLVHTNRPLVAVTHFINNEINAKCMHQLEDPLVIVTGQLSSWVQQIARICPFILSFDARQLLFKVTAFERDRALQHLIDTGIARSFTAQLVMTSNNSHSSSPNPFVPRIEKKKCSVSRKNLLQQAERIISEHGHSLAMIEVDYENEVGTGLGPTLEFFTLASKEIQKSALKLWREELRAEDQSMSEEKDGGRVTMGMKSHPGTHDIEMVKTIGGLFPRPIGHSSKQSQITKVVEKFRFLGKFLAKALLDGRLVDVPMSVACYKWLLGEEVSFTGMDLDYVDPGLSSTFQKFCTVAHMREEIMSSDPDNLASLEMDGCPIEDLGLDMCLPGYSGIELMKMGKSTSVTAHNLDKYLHLLVYWTLFEGVKQQMNAMREGFESVIPLSCLRYFYAEELDQLFCGSRYRPWDVQELSEACHPDHGYTQDSENVKALYRVLASYDATEQRNFLQFVTGCPHLPFGGLRSLNPPLTVVRKTCEGSENPDDYLPSVMTCLNYLKLPEYSNEGVLRKKLQVAMLEGQKSFLLS